MPVYDGYEIAPEVLPGKRKSKDRKSPPAEILAIPYANGQPLEMVSDGIAAKPKDPPQKNRRTKKSLRWPAVVLCGVILTGVAMFFLGRQNLAERATRYALARYDKNGIEDLSNLSGFATLFGENYKKKLAGGLYERTAAVAITLQGGCAGMPDQIIANGEFAVQFDPKQKSNWGALLFGHLERFQVKTTDYEKYCVQVVAWSPEMRPQLVLLSMKRLKESIRDNDAESSDSLAKQVITIDPQQKGKIAAVLWDELSGRMLQPSSLKAKGKDKFLKLATIFLGMEMYPEKGDEAGLLCLNGLMQYFENDKEGAVRAFQELRTKHGNSPFSDWSRIILSLAPGTRECKTSPIQIKDRNHQDVTVRLLRFHVSENEITLMLGFRAGEKEARVPYAYGHWKSRYIISESGEPLYLVDNFGKKLYCLGHFQGGRQYAHSIDDLIGLGKVENAAVLYVSPYEESVVSVSFPMISEGATHITFVSPKVAGMRDAWSLKDIPLKDDFFQL